MVELIPKKSRKTFPLQNIFFYVALTALFSVVSAYFVFYFSLKQASFDLQNLESAIAQTGTASEKQLEREVFDAEAKINSFSRIFKDHQRPSRIFPIVEQNTHPQVQFNSFSLDAKEGTLVLEGGALDFQILEQQIGILRSEKLFESVGLTNISMGEDGRANFGLIIAFDPQILK